MVYIFSEHWQSGPENTARGSAWLDRIYQRNRGPTIKAFEAHKDFGIFFPPLRIISILPALYVLLTVILPTNPLSSSPSLDLRQHNLRPLPLGPHHPRRY